MSDVGENLAEIRDRIAEACVRGERDVADVELIAVSKTFPECDIAEAIEGGQRVFGESRLQEAEPKIASLPPEICWHFIGGIQRNKVRKILPLFDVIHAVDSKKLLLYIDKVAKDLGLRPKLFLQVNQGGEASKGGFIEEEVTEIAEFQKSLGSVEIVGLMSIPPLSEVAEDARRWFVSLRELRDRLGREFGFSLPYLSMGMSQDFEVAIEEGATHVRVGSRIFGKRDKKIEGELG